MANTTFKGTLRSEGGYSSIATATGTGTETGTGTGTNG